MSQRPFDPNEGGLGTSCLYVVIGAISFFASIWILAQLADWIFGWGK